MKLAGKKNCFVNKLVRTINNNYEKKNSIVGKFLELTKCILSFLLNPVKLSSQK